MTERAEEDWGAGLGGWVRAGYLTAEEAIEVDATLALLLRYVRKGSIDEALARQIIEQLADEKAAAWFERQKLGATG